MTKREQRKRTQAGNARVQEFIRMAKFWRHLVGLQPSRADQIVTTRTEFCVFNNYFLFRDQVPFWYPHRANIKYCDITETTLLVIEYLRNYKNLWRNKEFVDMFTKEHNRILSICTYQ